MKIDVVFAQNARGKGDIFPLQSAIRGDAAAAAREKYSQGSLHDCARYAALRNLLLFKGKSMEIMVNYEPSLVMLGEWLKQLFDESEGKDHKGLFVTSANFSTDLHSIGQFIQDGSRIMFETVLWVKEPRSEITIEHTEEDIDGLRSDRAACQPEGVRGHADRPHGRRHAEYHPRD